jgi:hypothetical protein
VDKEERASNICHGPSLELPIEANIIVITIILTTF